MKKLSVLIALGLDEKTIKYMTSRQVNDGFASSAKAIIPAAMGADAEVPVWDFVHLCLMSAVTTALSVAASPLLKVDASVDVHSSRYHGFVPCSVTLLIDSVYTELT
jgi:hypothetical protein